MYTSNVSVEINSDIVDTIERLVAGTLTKLELVDVPVTITDAELMATVNYNGLGTPTISAVAYAGANGALVDNGGSYTFTPTVGYAGAVPITFTVVSNTPGALTANGDVSLTYGVATGQFVARPQFTWG